ncbi:MAG: DMT family transporter, partial [Aggregatilineales bacterium]
MGIWSGFWLLGLIWGASFMLIRVGVESVHPLHLVFLRVGIAAVCLCLIVMAMRKAIPRDFKTLVAIFVIGIGNTVIPFLLITWGEQTVESSMAAVLQATAALFTLVTAHFAFADERITPQKIAGLMLGFIGVIVLSGRNLQDGDLLSGSFAGQMAIVLASVFYAIFTTYSRKLIKGQVEPIVIAAGTMLSSALITGAMIIIGAALGLIDYAIEGALPSVALPAIFTLAVIN